MKNQNFFVQIYIFLYKYVDFWKIIWYNAIIMNNIDISNCAVNIDKRLIPNRIGIALFSYGLNEF